MIQKMIFIRYQKCSAPIKFLQRFIKKQVLLTVTNAPSIPAHTNLTQRCRQKRLIGLRNGFRRDSSSKATSTTHPSPYRNHFLSPTTALRISYPLRSLLGGRFYLPG